MTKRILLSSFAALAVAGLASAQTSPTAPTQPPPAGAVPPPSGTERPEAAPGQAGQAYRAKQVIGARINIQGNVSIGIVDDIVFNDAGMIEYMVVANEGKLVTVPWQAAQFNFAQRTAVVNITPEVYRTIPTYTVQQYPTYFAPAYRTEIYRYYGLTPGQERRLERRLDRNGRPY